MCLTNWKLCVLLPNNFYSYKYVAKFSGLFSLEKHVFLLIVHQSPFSATFGVKISEEEMRNSPLCITTVNVFFINFAAYFWIST